MSVPGVEVVGPLPGDLATSPFYTAGGGIGAGASGSGKALVKYLTTPEAQAVFKAKRLRPACDEGVELQRLGGRIAARVGMLQRDRMVLAGVERGARQACLLFRAIGRLVSADW